MLCSGIVLSLLLTHRSLSFKLSTNPKKQLIRLMSTFIPSIAGEGRSGSGADVPLPFDPSDGLIGWRTRIDGSIARSRKVRGGNYVQIATVDVDGMPRCRTVVFRGFTTISSESDTQSVVMKMITDKRSEKVSQIIASPSCELVWWFAKSSEQYRIFGILRLVGGDDSDQVALNARKQQWSNLSDSAREQFYWKSPGAPYEGKVEVPAGGRDSEGRLLDPPDEFLLMLLQPQKVKYLRLGDNFAQIDHIGKDGMWNVSRVNP
jgi:pyridoxamine 5'-phosphate oxidase